MTLKLVSWNVNGIRAALKKGLLEWLEREQPDIFCAQETKVQADQLGDNLPLPRYYHAYWNSAEKKGYSGVLTLSKEEPQRLGAGLGVEGSDKEGRVIISEYPRFTLVNTYFPNGKLGEERLRYKLDFCDTFLHFVDQLREKGQRIVCCGDFNTAHHEIDLARPRQNERVSGFLKVEREWLDKLEEHGFVDTFRRFNQSPGQYTWWDLKTRARERNVGWRIDYVYVSSDLIGEVSNAFILPQVTGSDHCPVGIELL